MCRAHTHTATTLHISELSVSAKKHLGEAYLVHRPSARKPLCLEIKDALATPLSIQHDTAVCTNSYGYGYMASGLRWAYVDG